MTDEEYENLTPEEQELMEIEENEKHQYWLEQLANLKEAVETSFEFIEEMERCLAYLHSETEIYVEGGDKTLKKMLDIVKEMNKQMKEVEKIYSYSGYVVN